MDFWGGVGHPPSVVLARPRFEFYVFCFNSMCFNSSLHTMFYINQVFVFSFELTRADVTATG